MSATGGSCPEHGPPAEPGHRFCEVCGRDLRGGEPAAVVPPVPWLSSRVVDTSCVACGVGRADATATYCDNCGRRWSVGRDRAELDLGTVAGVTDRGRRRRSNEDALTVALVGATAVAVICDGVSTSRRPDAASHAAAEAGVEALVAALSGGAAPEEATLLGIDAAVRAARATARPGDRDAPPSCTYVSAVRSPGTAAIGWVGDSRAYCLDTDPLASRCLTIDDSVAGRRAASVPLPPALQDVHIDPRALLSWLGADAGNVEPQIVTVRPSATSLILVCSDGLHHYLAEPAAMSAAVPGGGRPVDVARELTRVALQAGGHDNIAVAVLAEAPTEVRGDRPS